MTDYKLKYNFITRRLYNNVKKTVCFSLIVRVILSAGAMLLDVNTDIMLMLDHKPNLRKRC